MIYKFNENKKRLEMNFYKYNIIGMLRISMKDFW